MEKIIFTIIVISFHIHLSSEKNFCMIAEFALDDPTGNIAISNSGKIVAIETNGKNFKLFDLKNKSFINPTNRFNQHYYRYIAELDFEDNLKNKLSFDYEQEKHGERMIFKINRSHDLLGSFYVDHQNLASSFILFSPDSDFLVIAEQNESGQILVAKSEPPEIFQLLEATPVTHGKLKTIKFITIQKKLHLIIIREHLTQIFKYKKDSLQRKSARNI